MIFDEDIRLTTKVESLDSLSLDELRDRIVFLEAEIERVKAEIKRKEMTAKAAHEFFKS